MSAVVDNGRGCGRAATVAAAAVAALAAALSAGTAGGVRAQAAGTPPAQAWTADPPALGSLVDFARAQSDLRVAVDRYNLDRAAIHRRYDVQFSPGRRDRLREFYRGWDARLRALDFDALNHEGKVDYVLLRNRLEFERAMLDEEERMVAEMQPLLPFAPRILALQDRRRDREPVDARAAAGTLDELATEVEVLTARLREDARANGGVAQVPGVSRVAAFRAAGHLDSLRTTLQGWYGFYAGYDPVFTWWAAQPFERADAALEAHTRAIREDVVGIRGTGIDPIIGDPIGEAGLRAHLAHEMIPYTAAELIAIAEREFEWCEAELLKASRELGFGDDWRAAQEAVKQKAVDPGQKPNLIRELAAQSTAFLEARGEITIAPLAEEIWRMEMMSPERQLINPFFTGGETIRISYPTNTMEHDEKLMSMRGNNPHFNRATVHHELIPGHHLQGFMTDRFNAHRGVFATPFWGEGWALYWEMVLWDQGFPRGPEDRIGMLFWRMHRAARIIFSLSFHLERMSPEQAVDFLVQRVGHERANAEAEVRRSFEGSYSPLYQVAYMIGGMQFRALRQELVDAGRSSARDYHDAVLRGGRMPVELVRARLTDQPLRRDHHAAWRFAGDPRTTSSQPPPR
jgi:uncharacterized protein (DUF885 family)